MNNNKLKNNKVVKFHFRDYELNEECRTIFFPSLREVPASYKGWDVAQHIFKHKALKEHLDYIAHTYPNNIEGTVKLTEDLEHLEPYGYEDYALIQNENILYLFHDLLFRGEIQLVDIISVENFKLPKIYECFCWSEENTFDIDKAKEIATKALNSRLNNQKVA